MKVVVVSNPVIEYFLAKFRDKDTNSFECNVAVENISFFLAGEISKFMQTKDKNVITPLGEKVCPIINDDIILVPILRG